MPIIKDVMNKAASSSSGFASDNPPSSSFRSSDIRHSRNHVPYVATQADALPKPAPISAKIEFAGPRNEYLMARRRLQPQRGDSASYQLAFQPDPPKRKHPGPFSDANKKRGEIDRRTHERTQTDLAKLDKSLNGVELNLTPQSSRTDNGLLAYPRSKPSQLAANANNQNGGLPWQHSLPVMPEKRTFSAAKAQSVTSVDPSPKPKIHIPNTATRDALMQSNPQLHAANTYAQTAVTNSHRPPSIPPDNFYNQSKAGPSGSRAAFISPLPIVRPAPALSARTSPDPFTPEALESSRSTRSQAKRKSESALSDQSVVVIDSDDDDVDHPSPKYSSPKTHSEKKSVLERMIPDNVIQSLHKFGQKNWLFAYPVKDFRGVFSDDGCGEGGDHAPILPWSGGKAIAFLFFFENGDIVIVPDDGTRDSFSTPRSPQSFSLDDCASVVTTLACEDKTDSKNEFVLFFALKPKASFTPKFESDTKSPWTRHLRENVDDVVLVDDATCSSHTGALYSFDSNVTIGDTLPLQDNDSSVMSVDDAKSFSGLGFKLQNPVFVDNRVHLKETDCRPSVMRFNDFICDKIRPASFNDKRHRIVNATSSFTHVTVGIPRQKPVSIVEDPTELLDYKIPEPEKSCSLALDSSSAPPLRSKKANTVHRVISVGDFARLDKGECLSDATIDFYSSWLRESYPDKCRSIYFASSFFFKKLWSQTKDSKDYTDFSYMHKWNSIDIFSFDMVMFPVNLNYHWSLIVLENPAACLKPKGAKPCCRLLYLDSLLTWDKQIEDLFKKWITWMHMRKISPEGELTHLENFATLKLEGAKQENTFDCGVFVLRYMERLALHYYNGFKGSEFTETEKPKCDVQDKRKEMQRLVRKLAISGLNSTDSPSLPSAAADADGEQGGANLRSSGT